MSPEIVRPLHSVEKKLCIKTQFQNLSQNLGLEAALSSNDILKIKSLIFL